MLGLVRKKTEIRPSWLLSPSPPMNSLVFYSQGKSKIKLSSCWVKGTLAAKFLVKSSRQNKTPEKNNLNL